VDPFEVRPARCSAKLKWLRSTPECGRARSTEAG
jgi:hypothetical protein